jgi:hypothetical protein
MSYDPQTGQWREQDPDGYVDGLDLYEFVGDAPIAQLDPSGLASVSTQPTGPVSGWPIFPPLPWQQPPSPVGFPPILGSLPVVNNAPDGLRQFLNGTGGDAQMGPNLLDVLENSASLIGAASSAENQLLAEALQKFSCCKGSASASDHGPAVGWSSGSTGLTSFKQGTLFGVLGHNFEYQWSGNAKVTKLPGFGLTGPNCCFYHAQVSVNFNLLKEYTFNGKGYPEGFGTPYNLFGSVSYTQDFFGTTCSS